MHKKKKFKPMITRVKLNPEQAVLACCQLPDKGSIDIAQCMHFTPCNPGEGSGAVSS